jgi:hypothetical protein
MAKALLEHYGLTYQTTLDPCDEWPTVPAIYGITQDGKRELIGGYGELCELPLTGKF